MNSIGVGTFGRVAYDFIDFLSSAKQSYWQIGTINSNNSLFAGDASLIDIEFLVNEGFLEIDDINSLNALDQNKGYEEYRLPLLKLAVISFDTNNYDYKKFLKNNQFWIDDYSIYMAIKKLNFNSSLEKFPEKLKYKLPVAINDFKARYDGYISFFKITQYFFYLEYFNLLEYANKNGIKIIGETQFLPSCDSSDLFSNSYIFNTDTNFSSKNISYNNSLFNWWNKRIKFLSSLYDVSIILNFKENQISKELIEILNKNNIKYKYKSLQNEIKTSKEINEICYTNFSITTSTINWYNQITFKNKVIISKIINKNFNDSINISLIKFAMNSEYLLVIVPLNDYTESFKFTKELINKIKQLTAKRQ